MPKATQASRTRVANVVKLLQMLHDGKSVGDELLIKKPLTGTEYKQLLNQISKDQALQAYIDDKLRFDYTHENQEFVIRMSSCLHEHLAGGINRDILRQLDGLRDGPKTKTAELAGGIDVMESAIIEFPVAGTKLDRHAPDKSYQHIDCDLPGLVIEVAWSQRRLDLPQLAKGYIQLSKGSIRTVVGVHVEYRKKAPATFSVWNAEFGRSNGEKTLNAIETATNKVFRDKDGHQVPSTELRLPLTDFVCQEVASSFVDVEDYILISSAALCQYLTKAERYEEKRDSRLSRISKGDTGPELKWVGPSTRSQEELRPEDESKFEKKEDENAKRADKSAGPSFRGPKAKRFIDALRRSPRNHPSSKD